MLDGADAKTVAALRELDAIGRKKPLILWVGAGASAWAGYPLWRDLAEAMHRSFISLEADYPKNDIEALLLERVYPSIFSTLRKLNSQRYHNFLANELGPRPNRPVHERFIRLIRQIQPTKIITTNIDECLERNFPGPILIQRRNIERLTTLLATPESFIAKIHGTISDPESMVFTNEDYSNLTANRSMLTTLNTVFTTSTVVFIGTSLSDEYLLYKLREASTSKPIFGDGPHFVLSNEELAAIPSLRHIRYVLDGSADHRGALQLLEILAAPAVSTPEAGATRTSDAGSSYFIADVLPPGTWTSSQTLQITSDQNQGTQELVVGTGFVDSELLSSNSPIWNDLAVGLTCFDRVYVPFLAAGRLHALLGSEIFWRLVGLDALRFIFFESNLAIRFPTPGATTNGSFSVFKLHNPGKVPIGPSDELRRMIRPVPGKEAIVERQFEQLLSTTVIHGEVQDLNLVQATLGALLNPGLRRLLGVSSAVGKDSIPRWAVFPLLRLATVIQAGQACNNNGIQAIKLAFGSEVVASAAFAHERPSEDARSAASYVITGRLHADLARFMEANPGLVNTICDFRDTQPGVNLRVEVARQLSTSPGTELATAINAGLRMSIASEILELAQAEFARLMLVPSIQNARKNLAVFGNSSYGDSSLKLWRKESARVLREHCSTNGIGAYDQCPCGSGEKLKFCCSIAVNF